MNQQNPPPLTPQPSMAERRKARQALALRNNLKRRKAKAREVARETDAGTIVTVESVE